MEATKFDLVLVLKLFKKVYVQKKAEGRLGKAGRKQ